MMGCSDCSGLWVIGWMSRASACALLCRVLPRTVLPLGRWGVEENVVVGIASKLGIAGWEKPALGLWGGAEGGWRSWPSWIEVGTVSSLVAYSVVSLSVYIKDVVQYWCC